MQNQDEPKGKHMKSRFVHCFLALLLLTSQGAAFARGFGGGGFGGGFRGGGGGFGGFRGGGGGFGGGGHEFGGGGFGGGGHEFGGGGSFGGGGHEFGGGGNHSWGGGGNHSWGGGGNHDWGGGGNHNWGGGGNHSWGGGGNHDWNGGGNHNWGMGRISGNNFNSIHAGHNINNYSNNFINNRGNLVRNNFYNFHGGYYGGFYHHGWWGGYPGCWMYPGWGMGTAFMITSWATMAGMLALDATMQPRYYGYGQNVTYNNNQVYYNGQPYASASDYYNQAQTLATSTKVANVKPTKKDVWKPLGVYSLTEGDQTNSTMMFQLAIDKDGDIAGNYYDVLSDQMQQVHGKLDKKTQRVCWTVGTNTKVVYDTGLGNLLKEQAPILVHFGKDRTQNWILVRMKKPPEEGSGSQGDTSGDYTPSDFQNGDSDSGNPTI